MKRFTPPFGVLIWVLLRLIFVVCGCLSGVAGAATLDTHVVVLDGAGKIIPWTTNPADGYDRVMFLSWDLLKHRIPLDPANGLPVTYTYSIYDYNDLSGDNWPNNPAGKHAMLADAAVMYYAYSGDYAVIDLVRGLLDHQLQYGTTPANYLWANVPWSTAAAGSISYGNDNLQEGVGVLEPDKLGELGYHGYLKFYELTGDPNYLNAALACADALALHVRNGDATHSPWPFRVVAQTGVVGDEYCANVVAPIRLFDELISLGLGNTSAYQTARQTAWNWLMTYPMANRVWAAYFEDTTGHIGNLNQYCPGQTARYLLEHPELDANWFNHVTNMLGFIESTFGGTDNGEVGLQFGARVISEQNAYQYKMASHTSRFGAVNALLYEATGDPAIKEQAYRSLNWSTYMCRANGVVIEGPAEFAQNSQCWFTDGHGDYVRHFMLALGAIPEWAPAGQNHITRSTTVIKSVSYASNNISYTTSEGGSTETLRIAFTPAGVIVNGALLPQRSDLSQPGWVFNPGNGVLRIRHDTGSSVQVVAELPGDQPLTITTTSLPNGVVSAAYSASLTASGGTPPYGWSVAGGSLPPGLTLQPASGAFTGTPTATGTFNFTAAASDASNPVKTATRPLSITVVGTLISIAVTPANPSVLTGTSQQFTATGSYSDGGTQNLTSQATWTSSSTAVAAINASGLATAASAGNTTISAALGGVSGTTLLTVQAPPITITTTSLPNGTVGTAYTTTLTANGGTPPYRWSIASASLPSGLTLNTDSGVISGTPTTVGTSNFTVQVSDASAPIKTATKPLGITIISFAGTSATFGNTNEGTLTDYIWDGGAWINACRYQAISNITVSALRAKVGAITGKYKCAIYTDSSAQPSRLLRSTAEVSNPTSGWQSFPLTSSVVLTNGQFYWLAIWSDNANARVYYSGNNGTLRWGRYNYGNWPDPVSASVGGNLNYCIYATGTASTLTTVAVTPVNPVIVVGATQQFTATGTYSDGTTQNITSQATWVSSNTVVATANASGLATGVSGGAATIAATLSGVSGSTLLTVQVPLLITTSSLPNGTVNVNYSAALTASGGTAPYAWSITIGSLPSGLTLNTSSGAITGTPTTIGTFNFTVRASDIGSPGQSITKPLSITVVKLLTSVAVTPVNPVIVVGATQQFMATGTYSDGTTQNITSQATWVSSNAVVATVNVNGLATGVSGGAATIAATLSGVSGSTLLTVQVPLLITTSSLSNGTVNVAYSASLTASGGTVPYTWSITVGSLPAGLTLNTSSGAITGTPTTAGTSNFTVRASDTGSPGQSITKPLSITVVKLLTSVALTPANPAILIGATQQFTATGTYSDGTTQNITSQATWVSSNSAVATVNASGLATGVSGGTATIAATLSGVSGSRVLTVQAVPLVISTSSLSTGTVSAAYSATLAASGGTTPYRWSLFSGSLPPGLALNINSGTISGTPTASGTFNFTARVSDTGNPVQTTNKALSITVTTTTTTVTIWPSSAVPGLVDGGADSSVELGVKFRSDVAGTITGIRFYKASANTGTHVGNLWTTTGTLLASATFTGETTSGWQQVNFASPVAIAANTIYVASYHANNGHYSANLNYFSAAGVDNPPLHALRNGVSGGNGVYRYGTGNLFPNQTYYAANYWVDVVFRPTGP